MHYTNITMDNKSFWHFIDDNGTFVTKDPQGISSLYFPLANEAGMMSSITPQLKGDIKTDNNSFLMTPLSRQDILFSQSSRNFWIYSNNKVWSLAESLDSAVTLEAGFLYHKITKTNKKLGLQAKITNFVPVSKDCVELMLIEITNISNSDKKITTTSAIPIFGRSADNLRDHRHVTSLLGRIKQDRYGVILQPVMSFDERSHTINKTCYYVFGIDDGSRVPLGSFPTQHSYLGEGTNLNNPQSVFKNLSPKKLSAQELSGKEAIGALRFKTKNLRPKESLYFALILGIAHTKKDIVKTFTKFNSVNKIRTALNQNKLFWRNKLSAVSFKTGDSTFDNWIRWVELQPALRKIFGCSFLPDFDYGRGGKGWRDLWQDCLTLLLINPKDIRPSIISNFCGVRIDGSNATIITDKLGHFKADRNKISRVWMDHGLWPFFTLELYFNQTADSGILLQKIPYFRDSQVMRARQIDFNWNGKSQLATRDGKTYRGTILEHILIEHLVQFFNVGPHNCIRLENADWNDGLDMAAKKGESVAFSSFYAYNLKRIYQILEKLKQTKKIDHVYLLEEMLILLDTLNKRIDYNSISKKNGLLDKYLNLVKFSVSGNTRKIKIDDIIQDLRRKGSWLSNHISRKEWINLDKDIGFFNGYYDNKGRRIEGKFKNTIRMTLTGQVFPILSGIASQNQIKKIYKAAKKFLQDKKLKGFRLNTDFGQPQFNLGRAFAFSYGEKENGAIFSHMCVMFAYALYKRGFVQEGFQVLNSLYDLAINSNVSKVYPNLPEYFNLEGRGMYCYLTGSASWYIMTLLTQVFGICSESGNLLIAPKFVKEQFKNSKELSVQFNFANKKISVTYVNPRGLDYCSYAIKQIKTNLAFIRKTNKEILIKRRAINAVSSRSINIEVILG